MLKYNRKLIEIVIIVLTILFFLFRTTVPFLKFPFILLFFGIVINLFLNNRNQLLSSAKSFLSVYYLPVSLIIILIISFILSGKLYLVVFKDISNALILIILFYFLIVVITTRSNLALFIKTLINYIILFAIFISSILLYNLLRKILDLPSEIDKYSQIFSFGQISSDYNFALIPVLFGFIAVFYLLIEEKVLLRKILLNLCLILFSLTILLTGSRRGMMTLIVIFALLLFTQVLFWIGKDTLLRRIAHSSKYFILFFATISLLSWGYAYHTSYYFKNSVFKFIGIRDIETTRQKITKIFYKYNSIFDKDVTISEVYDEMWFHDSDYENYPDEGWGTRIHKTVFPLKGKNVEIVPGKAEGYLIDHNSDADQLDNKAFSSTTIDARQVRDGDIVLASVYCYVSKDFNGGDVKIYSEGSTFRDTVSYYSVIDTSFSSQNSADNFFYNLLPDTSSLNPGNQTKEKNLLVNGDFQVGKQFWTPGADSTTHEIVKTPFGNGLRVSRTDGDGGSFSVYYSGRPIVYNEGHTYRIKFDFKVVKGNSVPFQIGWAIAENNLRYNTLSLPIKFRDLDDGWKEATCSYKFNKRELNSPAFLHSLQDYSTVDIANVELEDLNRNNSSPLFVDQIMEMEQNRKGIWQKLTLKANCTKGVAPVYMYFSKTAVHDFSSLSGYVIFAYPQYTIISKNDSSKSSLIPLRKIISTSISKDETVKAAIKTIPVKTSIFSESKLIRAGLLPSFLPVQSVIFKNPDKDLIRKWASQLISEDTTYHGSKNQLFVKHDNSEFVGFRLMRWQFALQIYEKEFDWKQKIFGGGFNFLNWYGYYFENNKNFIDYPHNPFLSILLYSGVFGLIVFILFLYKSFSYYIKYFKEYKIISVFFLITFLFSFFSAGSPFDPPIMGFFYLLPFFIHYIHQQPEKP
jgi:hypothetical protein